MERRDFNDPKYKAWRKRVYGRDRFKCQMPNCTGTDKTLNAHHIKCWAAYPGLRFVTSNGITLCSECHKSVTGRETEFESLFARILGVGSPDVLIELMMRRYSS